MRKEPEKGLSRRARNSVDLIGTCARLMPDEAIAGMLNRTGMQTGRLNRWTQSRVGAFRDTHGIAVDRERECAELAISRWPK